jgi:hypothetical protein
VQVDANRCRSIDLPPVGGDPMADLPADTDVATAYGLLVALNAINYCYFADHGQQPWTWRGRRGFAGMLTLAVDHRHPRSQSQGLAEALVQHGTGLPLLNERLRHLDECRAAFPDDQAVLDLLQTVDWHLPAFVGVLVQRCPGFNDTIHIGGLALPMHKRAWLIGCLAERLADNRPLPRLRDPERLALCIDYRLPLACRRLGLLRLAPDLERRIDAGEFLPAGSDDEITLRMGTALVLRLLLEAHPAWSPAQLDARLFALGGPGNDGRIHHRTRTTAY